MTYPRSRSLKRWRYGTPAWKRRCDAAIRRDALKNEGKTGYAWMPHYVGKGTTQGALEEGAAL